jgi:hypothetical protein
MDKDILRHRDFVRGEIKRLRDQPDVHAAQKLLEFHLARVRDFQHERAVHLTITLFFAGLMIGVWILWFWIAANFYYPPLDLAHNLLPISAGILALILTVLEGFYIAHYYKLENRTQKLYQMTREIYELIR